MQNTPLRQGEAPGTPRPSQVTVYYPAKKQSLQEPGHLDQAVQPIADERNAQIPLDEPELLGLSGCNDFHGEHERLLDFLSSLSWFRVLSVVGS